MGLSLFRNTIEGAVLEFIDQSLIRYSAFVPRRFIDQQIGKNSDTPAIDAWFRKHSFEASCAVVNCNLQVNIEPPYDQFRASGLAQKFNSCEEN
ncbi:MAG: hypothetical protein BM558_06735 [Roseobacter sp. MedPE-SW]|nr:MAG: hypothetical protein BM558_06735 [Roseobacter sp. MedPE-SW]